MDEETKNKNVVEDVEVEQPFKEFMEGAEEIRFFSDSDVLEWADDDGNIHKVHWMDIIIANNGRYQSPLCVVTKQHIESDEELYGEPYEEGEEEIVLDVPYLTEENILTGVKMWIDKYYPEFSHLPVRYEDEDVVKEWRKNFWDPIIKEMEEVKKGLEDGTIKTITIEELRKELDLDDET